MVRCEASSGPAGQPFLALLNVWDVREVYGECQRSIIHQLSAVAPAFACASPLESLRFFTAESQLQMET